MASNDYLGGVDFPQTKLTNTTSLDSRLRDGRAREGLSGLDRGGSSPIRVFTLPLFFPNT